MGICSIVFVSYVFEVVFLTWGGANCCCRFHSLGEFDEVKRSCRKRLDGHNRRRRKPQPPSFLMTAEKFMYNYKGLCVSSQDS